MATSPAPDSARGMNPAELPDVYASIVRGDCLAPVFRDGDCLAFSRLEPPAPGDFVGLWIAPKPCSPAGVTRMVKRLVSPGWPGITFPFVSRPTDEVRPLTILEALNPPERFLVDAERVLAMHKVTGIADAAGGGWARVRPASAGRA